MLLAVVSSSRAVNSSRASFTSAVVVRPRWRRAFLATCSELRPVKETNPPVPPRKCSGCRISSQAFRSHGGAPPGIDTALSRDEVVEQRQQEPVELEPASRSSEGLRGVAQRAAKGRRRGQVKRHVDAVRLRSGDAGRVRHVGGCRRKAAEVFDDLGSALIAVRTPSRDAWILGGDETTAREPPAPGAPARLLPSGDAYTLGITSEDRALLVPDANRRRELWTRACGRVPSSWPGRSSVRGDGPRKG